ncbi:MAG: AarF/ABC1/UbiB kinase family protein [Planctomycetes bacterium]|nr:AarF/ABC1/UbiB kinase family protein [Planctomycetota bacterium]
METHPFRFLRHLGRTREIVTVLLNHGFGDLVERIHLRQYLQWGKRVVLRRPPEPVPALTRAQRIRMALESLGATFIKFGQVISTRPDLVPPDVITELEKLQEHVPPFPAEQAVAVVEKELGHRIDELFAEFAPEPLAAGSLAQVHRAKDHAGRLWAVKIRRPNVIREVERDIALMHELAILIERHVPEAAMFDPVGLVAHFARTIRREMNFTREGRTIDTFARLFRNDATLYVPAVDWDRTTDAVLTLEYVDGCHINDHEALAARGLSRKALANNIVHIFMKQMFDLGFFHGDPHPGNIRVLDDGSICLLDYGMVGIVDDEKREQFIDMLVAVSRQDVSAVVEIVQRMGVALQPIDTPLLTADVRDFIDTYYGLELERVNVSSLLTDFVNILTNHRIRCPADLMLLIRAMITLEGVVRDLAPDFNTAEVLAPYLEGLVRERYNPRRLALRALDEVRTLVRLSHDVPRHIGRTLEKLSTDDLRIQLEHRRLDRLITELDRSSNRIAIGMVIAALIVASSLVIQSNTFYWLSVPIFLLSSFLGAWLIYGIFRSGRL